MKEIPLFNVNANHHGFEAIARLYEQALACPDATVSLCLEGSFFNASLSPALYAVLKRVKVEKKVYFTRRKNSKVDNILTRNGFLPSILGMNSVDDIHDTTVKFRVFIDKEEEDFDGYVEHHVLGHRSFPAAPAELRDDIRNSYLELFVNSILHSSSISGLSACGQFFPSMNKLDFCIADSGIGIPGSVSRVVSGLSDVGSIEWAMKEGHTTRSLLDGVPGGLGFKLLSDFVAANGGRLVIVSGTGYYETRSGSVYSHSMKYSFPGTAALLTVMTDLA